jgi:uncharacterized integral membrane protein
MLWLKRIPIILIILAASAYVFIFCLRNKQEVQLDFLFIVFQQVNLEIAMLTSFICGGLFGLLSALLMMLKMRHSFRIKLNKIQRQHQLSGDKV